MKLQEFTEQDLIVLEGLVSNREEWALVKKVMQCEIDKFWEALRLTPIADEKQVAANHKLAVGVEAFFSDFVRDMEATHYVRKHPIPEVIDDQTKSLYQ